MGRRVLRSTQTTFARSMIMAVTHLPHGSNLRTRWLRPARNWSLRRMASTEDLSAVIRHVLADLRLLLAIALWDFKLLARLVAEVVASAVHPKTRSTETHD